MTPRVTARLAAEFEDRAAREEEVSDRDIHLSRLTGMAPGDVDVLCDFTREEGLLIVIRCPKRPARYFQGRFPPKPLGVKAKSDPSTGLVTLPNGTIFVSDYDLMGVYRFFGSEGYEKIFFSAPDPRLPRVLSAEAQALLDKIKPRLKAPFMHGAQDDYESAEHPNVQMHSAPGKVVDRFIAFNLGHAAYFGSPTLLEPYYKRYGLTWRYDPGGRHDSWRP